MRRFAGSSENHPQTLLELFQESLKLHRSNIAVIEDTGSFRCDITYEDLWNASYSVQETLAEFYPCGEKRSQFIAVCMDQCLVFPAVILGILRCGFGFACVDVSWTNDKQTYFLSKLQTPVLIRTLKNRSLSSEGEQLRVQICGTSVYFEKLHSEGLTRKCSHPMAYAVLTSGSTGEPKIVRVPHASIVPNVIDLVKHCCISSRDVVFLSSPSTFDPSIVDMFVALISGASLLITSKTVKMSASQLLQVLFPSDESQGITFLQTTPSLFFRWSEKELKEIVLRKGTSLRNLLLGGEPFPCYSKLLRCRGDGNFTQIFNIYGITEVSVWASIHGITLPLTESEWYGFDYSKSVPLGQTLSHTILQVKDCDDGSVISSGFGELFIGSHERICEVNDENCCDHNAPVFRATGDIVQILPDRSIHYCGRKDNCVKRWGHRVSLEKIENIALRHVAVKSACCVWDEVGHRLNLFVALRDGLTIIELRKHLMKSAGSDTALLPDEIFEVQDISLTVHGKVNRQNMSGQLNTITAQHYLLVKKKFSEFLCKVLGLNSLPDGSFVDYGGNSLGAMILITELETVFRDYPKDLAHLLLSGESLKSVCAKLCHFYQNCNWQNEDHSQSESTLQADHDKESEEEFQTSLTEKDEIVSFYTRGNSNCGDIPSFSVPFTSIKYLKINFAWKVDFVKCIDASPLCLIFKSGKVGIVIGSHSGKFSLVDGETGEERWSLKLPDRIESSACSSTCGLWIYIGCHNGTLYCIRTSNGKIKWSFPTKGSIRCLPVLCNGGRSVLFGAYDHYVYCLNSETGALNWRFSEPEDCDRRGNWLASPCVIGDIAILCSQSGNVHAVQTNDGFVIWQCSFKQPIFSTPCHYSLCCGTFVVIAEVGGAVHCLEIITGKQVWFWQAPDHLYAPLTIVPIPSTNDSQYKILVGCYDSQLYCFTVSSKNDYFLEWNVELAASIASAAFPFRITTSNEVSNLHVIVSNKVGMLFVVGLLDGLVHSQYLVDGEVFSSPVVYNNKVYYGCRDNNLLCLDIQCLDIRPI